jgi:hypothetical protein
MYVHPQLGVGYILCIFLTNYKFTKSAKFASKYRDKFAKYKNHYNPKSHAHLTKNKKTKK